jgi:SAM-dependent methyltransferase
MGERHSMSGEGVAELARVGFGRSAVEYERGRPGYPPGLVQLVADVLELRPGRTVVDLAAGTGKLTRLLVPTVAQVVAVEPLPEMRNQLSAAVPDVALVAARAEEMPFADASVDAVTAAQAFHWFDIPRALDELVRVLRPGGGLGVVYNCRPRSGWAAELGAHVDRLTGGDIRHPGESFKAPLAADDRFTPPQHSQVDNVITTSPDMVLVDFASRSYVAALDPADRDDVLAAITAFLAAHSETAGRERLTFVRPAELTWCYRR